MKKFIALLLALLLVVPAFAEAEISVVATTYPLYDVARNCGGEYVSVIYAPDGKIPEGAQIVLCVSDEVEIPEGTTAIRAVDGVELIEGDTDVLTVPVNVLRVGSNLTSALQELDAEHVTEYGDALSSYIDAALLVDADFRDAADAAKKVKGSDGSMAYFAAEYGFENAPDAEDAIELRTYNTPDEADLETPYFDLMRKNLEALTK